MYEYEYEYGSSSGLESIGIGMWIVILLITVLMIVSMWKLYVKAGQPGWAAIIPIYNIWVLLKIVGRPEWWIILFLIPCVNIVIQILVYIDLAKVFGKSTGFAIGLILLPVVFIPILAFGDADYVG
jgi:hypothetical protein